MYCMPFASISGEEGDRVRRRETEANQSWNQEATVRMVCGIGPCGGRSSIQKRFLLHEVSPEVAAVSVTDAASTATYSRSCIGQGQFNHKTSKNHITVLGAAQILPPLAFTSPSAS